MRTYSVAPSIFANTVGTLLRERKRHDKLLFIILFVVLVSFTPMLVLWGTSVGLSVVVGVLIALVLAGVLVCWPTLGLYLVAASAFAVEQQPLLDTPIGTDRLYIFHWPPQLEGLVERPIGVLFLLVLFLWVFPRFVHREPLLQGGALFGPFLFYLLCAVGAVVYGLGTGGNLKVITVQFRPFWYLFLSYILAYNFVTRKGHVRGFFWLVIVSAGVKGLQGLYIYQSLFHGDMAGHDTLMSHEESFFFATLLLLIVIFCLHYRYRPQLIAAICVAPVVLISMVINNRRTDYTALIVGIGISWLLVFLMKPHVRRALVMMMIICVVLGAAYVAAFSHSSGTFAQPARAIVATFNPSSEDTRNTLSNLYRVFENNDLKFTIHHYPLGLGFGKAFLQPQPLESIFPGIIAFDPYYNYVPHNTIYWIWTDLGPVGYFSLWLLFGSVVVRGCVILRQLKDPYLQVVAIYIVAVAVMEVVVAFADYQLFFYRNVIDLGLLCGLLVKLPILDQEQEKVQINESTNGLSISSRSTVGSKHA